RGRHITRGDLDHVVNVILNARAAEQTIEDAAQQRIGAQAIGAVVGEVGFTHGIQAGDIGHHGGRVAYLQPAAFFVLSQSARDSRYGVVVRGEDDHPLGPRIEHDGLLVYLHDAFKVVEDCLAAAFLDLVAQVEIDHVAAADAQAFLADLEDFAGGDVARDDV